MSHTKSEKNKAKEYFYKEGVKNVGKEKTIEGLKRAFAKKMPKSEWHPIGAGRIGDKYKGGTITKIDYRNAKAKISK